MLRSNWEIVKTPFHQALKAFNLGNVPPSCSIVHFRRFLRLQGLWPLHQNGRIDFYRIFNMLMIIFSIAMALSLAADVCASVDDIVRLGDDMVMLLGVGLVLLKICFCRIYTEDLESLILEMDDIHRSMSKLHIRHPDIGRWQRIYFMAEVFAYAGYSILGYCLTLAICLHPIMSNQPFPINSLFPFELHNVEKYPNLQPWIYLSHVVFLSYYTAAIITMDSVTCALFSQTSVNLKVLCVRLRSLGSGPARTAEELKNELRQIVLFHQHLINLVDRINQSLNWNYLAQMGASTFIICLTAFEALLAKDQPLVAMKFQIYMFAGLSQLFYWCFMCNIMCLDSMEVANAAWDIHEWFTKRPEFQRNLMFIIQRAQKPLTFRASSLPALNFELFMRILSSSYSYFTLLRSFLD